MYMHLCQVSCAFLYAQCMVYPCLASCLAFMYVRSSPVLRDQDTHIEWLANLFLIIHILPNLIICIRSLCLTFRFLSDSGIFSYSWQIINALMTHINPDAL